MAGSRQVPEPNHPAGAIDQVAQSHLDRLVALALSLGASDARAIASGEIVVRDELALKCVEPRCENYGLSPSCPPHVAGPAGFRALQQTHPYAVAVRMVVPAEVLLSADGRDVGRYLHELVAAIEQEAAGMGYVDSWAFAGGSCKRIFCGDHPACRRLSEDGPCRHPEAARPSMSGFGIDVMALVQTCGWPVIAGAGEPGGEALSWLAGLILIG